MGFMTDLRSNQAYKRGQVEWAVWRAFSGRIIGAAEEPPPVFLTRIKRLLELDRLKELFKIVEDTPSPHAFFESAPEGTGYDTTFTDFDAFCLLIALDLLDAGFKQKEIVFLMRFLRQHLRPEYFHERVLEGEKKRHISTTTKFRGVAVVDNHVFLIVRKVELTEVTTSLFQRTNDDDPPLFFEPIFCRGYDALGDAIANLMPRRERKAMVVEIAESAVFLTSFLKKAPALQRGRP
jgi:hypothetical protein